MTLYAYLPKLFSKELKEVEEQLVRLLERTGETVVLSTRPVPEELAARDPEQNPLDLVDAIILEGTEPDPEVGYLLAYAIGQKKPLLHLTRKGHNRQNPLETFTKSHRLPSSLVMAHYDPKSLERIVVQFLGRLDGITFTEVADIKFTLRITPSIERYLDWKAKQGKITKADFMRHVLNDEMIAKDEAYKRSKSKRERPAETDSKETDE